MRRYLETLFRYRLLFFTPLVLVPIITVGVSLYLANQTIIRAAVWVEPSEILNAKGTIIGVRNQLPNESEALAIAQRLKTETFRREVMDRVGLTAAISAREWPRSSPAKAALNSNPILRRAAGLIGMRLPATEAEAMAMGLEMVEGSLTSRPLDNNLIVISYTGSEPALGAKLITETIRLHSEMALEIRKLEAAASVDVLTVRLKLQRERLDAALAGLQAFLEANPAPLPGQQRPPEEEIPLQRLDEQVKLERGLFESTLKNVEALQVMGEASASVRNLSFRLIDAPEPPTSSQPRLRQIVMMGIMGMTLGLMTGVVAVVLLTWRDNTVRTQDDLERVVYPLKIIQLPRLALVSKEQPEQRLLRIAMGWVPSASPSSANGSLG